MCIRDRPQSLSIKIINPRVEPQKGSGRKKPPFQALGLETLSVIEQAIKKNKKIAIFINRRGLATSIICQECGFVPKCPNCDIPLGFHLPAIDVYKRQVLPRTIAAV